MIAAILSVLNGIIGWLNGVLPNSPLQSAVTTNNAMLIGLGWLNWLIPVQDFLAIFTGFLAVLLLYTAIKMAIDTATGSLKIGFGK